MTNLTSVGITSGVPTSGTGTVSTIDNLIAVGLPISNGTSTAAIKAASTAPGATDPALVVSISPNSVNANGQATMANSAPVVLASNQSNLPVVGAGTAGTPSGGVVSIQGVSSGTVVPVSMTSTTLTGTSVVSNTYLTEFGTGYYVTVAASQTATVLQSSTGTTGDYVSGILVIPATTSPGSIALLDNATSITIFTGGASSVTNLVPFFIPLSAVSRSGAWKLTTGTNVSCVAVGKFS